LQAATDARDDMEEVVKLRSNAITLGGSPGPQREALAKYYRALSVMESRFPIGKGDDQIPITFVWYDAFK
jgi:programmed cell death 6-interacting protein